MVLKGFRSAFSGTQTSAKDDDEFHDATEAQLHPNATPEGGITCNDKTLIQNQRRILIDIAKQLGMKLMSGSLNLINITLPVIMFEPRSYLQKLADPWVHPEFMLRAAQSTDPVERLKLLTTWFVAGLQHIFASWRKPFNPILGETWQAQLSDGTQIFMEQTLHHPPVTAFTMVGPGGLYTFEGLSQPDVSYKGNSIRTSAKGYRRVVFADGSVVTMKYPYYQIEKIMYPGEPTGQLKGTAEFVDLHHNLVCEVSFGPVEGSNNPLLTRQDSMAVCIFRRDVRGGLDSQSPSSGGSASFTSPRSASTSSRVGGGLFGGAKRTASTTSPTAGACLLCTGDGNWLSHLNLDGVRYWTLSEAQADTWQQAPNPLPSDCRFREDLLALQSGRTDESQALKKVLEERQRAEAKARPKFAHTGCQS